MSSKERQQRRGVQNPLRIRDKVKRRLEFNRLMRDLAQEVRQEKRKRQESPKP